MSTQMSGILIKKDKDGNEIWVYPITTSDNIIHNETEQLDEVIESIKGNMPNFNIQVGETLPESVNVDTYFMQILSDDTTVTA